MSDYLPAEGDIHFMGSIQPMTENSKKRGYKGTYMTRGRKLQLVNNWLKDKRQKPPPLCIDHADGDNPDFQVPADKIIGYVTGIFIDPDDSLMMTGFIRGDRREAMRIFHGMTIENEQWGLSGFTRFFWEENDPSAPDDATKEFTHVGVTLNPDMAEEGSWIHYFGLNPNAIPRIMREDEIPRGALANEHSLALWNVEESVARNTLSVLANHISAAISAGDITPTPFDLQTTHMSNPGSAEAPPPSAPLKQPTGTNKDGMDLETPDADAPPQLSSTDLVQQLLEELTNIKANDIDLVADEYEKMAKIEHVIQGVNGRLKEHGIALQEGPDALQDIYYQMKNEARAINEKIETMIMAEGAAINHQNADLVKEWRDRETPAIRKRNIAVHVKASRDLMDSTQKRYEAELQQERQKAATAEKARLALEEKIRTREEEVAKKRKADDDLLTTLKQENERLKKRREDMDPLRRPSSGLGLLDGYSSPAPTSYSSNRGQSSSSSSSSPPPQPRTPAPPPPQDEEEAMDLDLDLGEIPAPGTPVSSSRIIPGGNGKKQAPSYTHVHQPDGGRRTAGYVTATGFRMSESDSKLGTTLPHTWLSKFVMNPAETSYASHWNNPVFQRTFDVLKNLGPAEGGAAFVHDIGFDDKSKFPVQEVGFEMH